jgi:AcrR family transcriptional regulator
MSSPTVELELPVIPMARPGPSGGVRDANRREKAQTIARAALNLFVNRGIERVSVDEICAAAEIPKGSFYRYFPDKHALVEAITAPLRRRILEAAERCNQRLNENGDPMSAALAYAAFGEELMPAIVNGRDVVRLYLQESRAPGDGSAMPLHDLALRIDEVALRLSDTAVRNGLVEGLPSGVAARVVVGAAESLANAWIHGRLDVDIPTAMMATTRIILRGVWYRDP